MRWSDKTVIFLICSGLLIIFNFFDYAPVILCTAVILTCAHYIFKNIVIHIVLVLLFAVLCFFIPEFIFFLPLIVYDNFLKPLKYTNLVLILPMIYHFSLTKEYLLIVLLIMVTMILKYKTEYLVRTKEKLIRTMDDSIEYGNLLKEKNESLTKNQDYEIKVATLNERSRISKELHDSIGHMLSRSLIHVGAISTISSENNVKQELENLKEYLSEGMDTVRETIHNMRDESFDLHSKLKEIIDDFKFSKIDFEYEVKTQPPIEVKYFMLSTLKETLANIIRHSDAKNVYVTVIEHPSLYQFVVFDNGKVPFETRKK